MTNQRVRSCAVALILVLGGLVLSAPASAQNGYKPCSLVSLGETEALAGERVVKSLESAGANSVCQRWLTGNHMFLLTVGVMTKRSKGEADKALGGQVDSKQFGEITCATVAPSKSGSGSTTCVAEKGQLFFGDGFDNATSGEKDHLFFILQITAGPDGIVPMDRVSALAEKVLARMP